MQAISLNKEWQFIAGELGPMNIVMGVKEPEATIVDLPHDAMIREKRSPKTGNSGHTGYYPGGVYTYLKKISVPLKWENKDIYIEFEGVQANAMVYINGDLAVHRPNGYAEFHVCLNDFLLYGAENEIKVVCNTAMERQSRWYTGSGIYRNVNLYVADTLHTKLHGIRITTADVEREMAVVEVNITVENNGHHVRNAVLLTDLYDTAGKNVNSESTPLTLLSNGCADIRQRLMVEYPTLWDCDEPNLYTCVVRVKENGLAIDESRVVFGIRKLQLDAKNGLRINGKRTDLRGACIHHDNGVLGAATFPRAEERRVEQLKAAGFNCIRSAHNPCSRALLDACDRLGMLVIDETFDVWTTPKTTNDYANFFLEWWERDTQAMVLKDINHPCVILYSIGNELPEAGTRMGKNWNRKLVDKIRSLDDTRFITNALNLALLKSFGEVMDDVLGKAGVDLQAAGSGEGANALNDLLSQTSGQYSDQFMAHKLIDEDSNECFGALDIASMNYAPGKYGIDQNRHPNRIILGSEDFPGDIVRLWAEVKANRHVIGDMTWTGYDYLGEAGSGTFDYEGRGTFGAAWPTRLAGMGDIDLIGNRHPISYLREIVYGLRKEPYIGIERVCRYGQAVNKTAWKLYDDIAGWTWPGHEDQPARIHVYSASEEIELLLNGASLGKMPAGEANGYISTFETTYRPGKLEAIGYTNGIQDGKAELFTASQHLSLYAEADRSTILANGEDLSFITIKLCDENGVWNHSATKTITVHVDGAGSLQGLGNADPFSVADYYDNKWETYDGTLLAVVKSGFEPGVITLRAFAEGCADIKVNINVKEKTNEKTSI